MKTKFLDLAIGCAISVLCGVAALVLICLAGCNANQTSTAINADAVVIQSVNAAMTAWTATVNAGKANAQQVTSVSNAYVAYYNSQLVLSNLSSLYVANPSTNLSSAITTAEQALSASSSNIVNIVNTFTSTAQ